MILMNYNENFKEMDESTKVGPILNTEWLYDQHYDDTCDLIMVKY